jgi:phosphatidate cytidylyltransferase
MLRWRLLLGALLIAALAALCRLDAIADTPGVWLLPVVLVFTILATKELLDLMATAGMNPVRWAVYLVNLFLVALPWIQSIVHRAEPNGAHPMPQAALNMVVAVYVIFLIEIARYRQPGGHAANIASGIFAAAYLGFMLALAVMLRMTWGVGALVAWIVVAKMGDTGAYAVGCLIGRHKIAPLLSPGKTVEGAFGALAFSCLGSWLAFTWIVPRSVPESISPGPWWGWIVFGLLVGLAGLLGDLAESLLKRDVGAKDSSSWLPGFGGVLDIIDSLLLSVPVAWLCWASGLVGR